jgi:hypothetical protein
MRWPAVPKGPVRPAGVWSAFPGDQTLTAVQETWPTRPQGWWLAQPATRQSAVDDPQRKDRPSVYPKAIARGVT